uniref:G-protein coupled receptors family 1 profile domain-containing protein n=1 Tax=Varanus komodoensis TaxID=61221 RepID=A0A8D2LGG3_VARKO
MTNNSTSCCVVPLNTIKYFKIPVYTLVLLAGLPLNCFAFWAVVSQLKRSVLLSVYVMNLLLANLLQILTLPFWMYHSYRDQQWGLGDQAFIAVKLAFRTNFYAKNNFLCLIAMERYLGLVHLLRFHRLQEMAGATKVSIAMWLLVLIPCIVGIWLEVDYKQTSCPDSSQLNYHYALFRISIMTVSFLTPCLLMGFFYLSILLELRKVVSLERRVKRQIYWFVSLIIITFFLFFTPFQVTLFYRYFWEVKGVERAACNLVENTYICLHATRCLATLNNIFDPLLYILLLKDVRTEIKVVLGSKARKSSCESIP